MKRSLSELEKEDPGVYRALLEFQLASKNILDLFSKRWQEPPWDMRTTIVKEALRCLVILAEYDMPPRKGTGGGQ